MTQRHFLDTRFKAMVVGSQTDGFVTYAARLFRDYEFKFVVCDNIYSAVARLVDYKDGNVLVIGRIECLSVEGKRFFEKLSERKSLCCCLAEMNSVQKYLEKISAIGTEAIVINQPSELKEVLERVLEGSLSIKSDNAIKTEPLNFKEEEFLTTKAEIEALLGNQLNDS
ncbi:MAG: hypothetical protein ACYSSI_10490 [Planctomycetota bacterium]|jgi:hypothetical protein